MRPRWFIYQGVVRPEHEQAMTELRRSLWYRLGVVLIWRIVLTDFAAWCLIGAAAAELGASDSQQRAIGRFAISVFLLATALAAMIGVPLYLVERRCRRKFGISAFDGGWRNKQFVTQWRDLFTMRLRSRRPLTRSSESQRQ